MTNLPPGKPANDATTARARALALLDARVASAVAHLGSDLVSHLLSTEALLRSWEVPENTALAGLCHALYGTDGFAPSLLDLSERERAVEAIGATAERAVYLYAACARKQVYAQLGQAQLQHVDRFTGERSAWAAEDVTAFALITAANELDLVQRGVFDAATVSKIRRLLERLAPYAPESIERALSVCHAPQASEG